MNKQPSVQQVSVIIPVFNRPDLLRRAIQSILAQSHQNFEILIVDDGSDPPIQNDFDDERVQLRRHERNRGTAAARNTGIRAARGTYLAFLDADDVWMPEKIERQYEYMRGQPQGKASVTAYYLKTPDLPEKLVRPPNPKSWERYLLMNSGLADGSTLMVERSCYEEIGYLDESLSRYQGWEWLLEYSKKYPLLTIDDPLTRVEKQGRGGAIETEKSALHFVAKHQQDFERFGFYGSRALAKRWLALAEYFYFEGNKQKGKTYLLKALRQNPFQRPGMYLRILDYVIGTSIHTSLNKIYHFFIE